MGVQSILEEVDFDNEKLAALKSLKEGAAKSRWVLGNGQALTSTRYPTRPELFFCYPNPTRTIFQNLRV